ncbi:carbamoyltransferase HypF [Sinimarinibacterium sp. CAU 1509]|uniref:carbamoyltransferase HypF n=1 Tax=Sinimarinibacterium sp. CAU 1509 TaxID=2562283 RepID=UPI0010ACE3CD|nr:carbamoyltransferase HypF [Sinimarinibacterium sp. CAU 1509]TJY60038.1 carbamoyltransferase HypF [Sinimarinibacterium sp. CAU 1509]
MTTLPNVAAVPAVTRQRFWVRGIVQGVGFRPFVYALAQRGGLAGFVRNDGAGVSIEVEGAPAAIQGFRAALRHEAPPRARIDTIRSRRVRVRGGHGFAIVESQAGVVATAIGPDSGVCPACLQELFDPQDRRYRYPFINCTHCGPRYTITRALPYDRAQTSMARFTLCPPCAVEYADVGDRRFHAEPTACADCGPRVWFERDAVRFDADDAIAEALHSLRAGQILAVKGLGGFHLVCDARNADAVARLRRRKQRDAKPFALMAANVESLRPFADVDVAQQALMQSPERPIVLLDKIAATDLQLPDVAPGLAQIGVMLPYTPLQYLLFHEAAGRPAGTGWLARPQDLLLVMTSANPGGEPLVRDNDEARARLDDIADGWLLHDRDIVVRCDDSVLRATIDGPRFLRRARGYTPLAIALTRSTPPVLAYGAWYKNTVCVTRGAEAFVSQHIGDLDNAATCRFLDETVTHLCATLAVQPAAIAHDLHPDFYSSQLAVRMAQTLGVPAIAVQHHHAHIAAVLAEHRIDAPVLGLALDGVGLGNDGSAWGGELIRVDGARMQRLGHLRALALPGGDRAAREPWRMAASALHELGLGALIVHRFSGQPAAATLTQMLARDIHAPRSSSLGRIFDAAAGLLGLCLQANYEGQAAMMLEALAAQAPADALRTPLPQARRGDDGTLDLLPLLAELVEEKDPARGAARFHAALADALADWLVRAARQHGIDRVAGAGGCFLNLRLSARLHQRLAAAGLHLLQAQRVPPNDGGLSLGQAWVAQRATFKD